MTASDRIDELIAGITDWRGKVFADVRKAIRAADPDIVEEWKWMGSPVWSRDGMIAVANAHKGKVKLTFMHGARLDDPDGPVQRRPRRQRPPRHRLARGRHGESAGADGAGPHGDRV